MSIDLKNAFPPMEDAEYHALMDAARSVKEEGKPMKRKIPKAALIFAVLTLLMATVALAEGLGLNLLDRLFRDMDVNTLPGLTTTPDVLVCETEHAVFTVKEAVFDGQAGSVLVEVQARDEKTLLTPFWNGTMDTPVYEVFWDESLGDMTIGEYLAAGGYEQMVMVNCGFPKNIEEWAGESHTGETHSSDFDGSHATILCTFSTRGADIEENMITQSYEFTSYPCIEEPFPSGYDKCEGAFTVPVDAEPLWTRTARVEDRVFRRRMRISSITLTGTRLGVYMEIHYELPHVRIREGVNSSNAFYFHLTDAQGERLAGASLGVADRYTAPNREQQTYIRSYQAMETPPESGTLWLEVSDWTEKISETMRLVWEE